MSFAARILSQKSRVYCLQYDQNTAQECYFFLKVDSAKEQVFLRAISEGAPNRIEEFGIVVASGWGKPGVAVREAMQKKYGVEFNATD